MMILCLSSWKDHFLQKKTLEQSNTLLKHLCEASNPSRNFETSFDEISKNPGLGFLFLDPNGTEMQLFHHPTIVAGCWSNPSKTFVAIIGKMLNQWTSSKSC
jgi:hypothetical protein